MGWHVDESRVTASRRSTARDGGLLSLLATAQTAGATCIWIPASSDGEYSSPFDEEELFANGGGELQLSTILNGLIDVDGTSSLEVRGGRVGVVRAWGRSSVRII